MKLIANLCVSLLLIISLVVITTLSPDGLPSSLLIKLGFSIPTSFVLLFSFLATVVIFTGMAIWGVVKSGVNS